MLGALVVGLASDFERLGYEVVRIPAPPAHSLAEGGPAPTP